MKNTPQTINNNMPQNTNEKFRLNPVLTQPMRRQSDTKYIRAVAEDIVLWARTPDALTLESFYLQLQVTDDTVENWCKKYKFLDDAVKQAKMAIGVRREEGLITNKYNGYVAKTLHNYLNRCKKSDEWHVALKQQADEKTQQANISWVLEKLPSSKLVPKKEIHDE